MIAGVVMVYGFLVGQDAVRWTQWYLVTIVATVVTGFLFPFHGFTPALAVGGLSSILLIATFLARYRFGLSGHWRWIYVTTAVVTLYLDWFVFVVQSFQKIPVLHALAPTGSEPPFAAVQGIVLVLFLAAGLFSVMRFKRPVFA